MSRLRRTRDDLVAQHLFGWKWFTRDTDYDRGKLFFLLPADLKTPRLPVGPFLEMEPPEGVLRDYDAAPRYGDDVAETVGVVKRLGDLGFNVWIEWKGKGRGYEGTAEVSVNKVGEFGTVGHGVGDLGTAVVSAAIMAVAPQFAGVLLAGGVEVKREGE